MPRAVSTKELFQMVFSSNVFLFYFLSATLVGYALLMKWRKASNLFLTFMSLGLIIQS